jgi:S1-C subfamily serine protease
VGRRILTCAHIVLYAGDVKVQARRGGRYYRATVEALGPAIDLAVLRLEDEAFFQERPPLPRAAGLPAVTTAISVYGYPIGGTGLAVTKGGVSRIDYAALDATTNALHIQANVDLNPGNSGGPALVDGRMIGLVFGQDGNTGYILAYEEIDTFLDDIKDGRYDGKPRLLDHFQGLENPALRAKLGLGPEVEGIMVREPARTDPTYPLCAGDVLTNLGAHAVDNEGMVRVSESLQLPFLYMVPKLARGGTVPLTVLRGGMKRTVAPPVVVGDDRLVRDYRGEPPIYFVCGPLVFSPVREQALPSYFSANPLLAGRNSPLTTRHAERVRLPDEELVVVTAPMLHHRMTQGYTDPFGLVLRDVNGVAIRNLQHLVTTVRDSRDEFLTFRFAGDLTETLIFRRQEMLDATAPLLAENGIPRCASADLMAIWAQGNAP